MRRGRERRGAGVTSSPLHHAREDREGEGAAFGGVVEREVSEGNTKPRVYISPINQTWIWASLVGLLGLYILGGGLYNMHALENN